MNNKFLLMVLSLILIFLTGCESGSAETPSETPPEVSKANALVIPVETMVVSKKNVAQVVSYTGKIEAKNSVDIIAEVSGKVEKINKRLGDKVRSGEPLAIIDYRIPEANYRQAQAQVLSAENNLNIVTTNLNSDQVLFSNGDISKLALDNSKLAVKTAQANLMSTKAQLKINKKAFDDTKLSSPISGFISKKNIELGTMVNIGSPVYRVVDLSEMKIKLGVPQDIVGKITKQTAAKIFISSLRNKSVNGSVKYISPQADEQTGTFEVEIYAANTSDFTIKAGMTVKVDLALSAKENKLVVPDYAVVAKDNATYVYIMNGERAKLTKVTQGESFGSNIEIIEGLNEGDEIVVVGIKNLGVDTKVKVEKKYN